ncbi:hypothetical protein AOLI_G00029110 [Acnodon oligacanthus]
MSAAHCRRSSVQMQQLDWLMELADVEPERQMWIAMPQELLSRLRPVRAGLHPPLSSFTPGFTARTSRFCSGRVSAPSTPVLEPSQRGEWVTTRRSSQKAKANANAEAKASPPEHHAPSIRGSNRFAPLSEAPAEEPVKGALVIGDSIVRHVKLATPLGTPAVRVRCLLGARAPDISGNLRLLADRRYSRLVIHVGANDIRLRQSEITKANVREVIKQAQTVSNAVICSGPIPMRRGAEAYSRLSALNCWMSKWCSENQVGFIDNWSRFEGKPGLIGRVGVHPTREGAALLSCSIAHSLLVSRQSSVNSS